MAITIKASTKAIEEAKASGDLENVPAGYHIFRLANVETGKSKSGNPQLVCHYALVGLTRQGNKPGKKYWPLRDYVQLEGETTEWKRAEFLAAMGVDKAGRGGTKLEIEPKRPGSVIGKLIIGRVAMEQYDGEDRPKMAKVLPYVEPVDGLDEGDFDEGDIPEEAEGIEEVVEETTEVDEVVMEDEDGDDAFVPWERDALKAAGREKIREVADSFGVEIIKGMTAANVLDAIMEAQENYLKAKEAEASAEGEGSEVDDEDEPF